MGVTHLDRRLLAILAVDVVGYSAKMEADEKGTISLLTEVRRDIAEPLIAEHHGQIVKLMGDGALVTFESVVDAVGSAVAFQRQMTTRNAPLPEAERIVFRMGVNLGHVALVDGDIYGDGVNVAARLEQLCPPGGITVSGPAYDQLQGKVDAPIDFVGDQQIKNISRPVRTYQVRLQGVRPPRRSSRTLRTRFIMAAALLSLPIATGAGWWLWPEEHAIDKRGIAVLPFADFAATESTSRLADGITEDIITDLSRFRDLDVIARNSTAVYKGKPTDVREVGKTLGVRYVLEGSIQREGDRARVTAQLIDAGNGADVWSQRWDRPVQDLFDVQSEISESVASKLGGNLSFGLLTSRDVEQAHRKPPQSLSAYELYLIAVEGKMQRTKESVERGFAAINRAIAIDPTFARAYTVRSWLRFFSTDQGADWNTVLPAMDADLKNAVALDPNDAETHAALANYYGVVNRVAESEREIRLALTLNPNHVHVIVVAASTLPYLGHPEEAAQLADRALRLDPYLTPSKLPGIAEGYFYVRRFTDVIRAVERLPPESRPIFALQMLGASYAFTGNPQKAQEIATILRQRVPGRTAQAEFANGWYFAGQQEENLFFESFRVLGLPMCATDEQLAKIRNPKPLPECVVAQVKG